VRRLRSVKLLAAAALAAAGFAAVPVSGALANTNCGDAQYPTGHSGIVAVGSSTYYGWCNAGGGYVHFRMIVTCPNGGGGTTAWASGSGNVTVYTQEETCWFGQSANEVYLVDG
jgi:hypothetical protein